MLKEDCLEQLPLFKQEQKVPLSYSSNREKPNLSSSHVSFNKQLPNNNNNKEQDQLATERILYFEGVKIRFSTLNLIKKNSQIIELSEENSIKVLTDVSKIKITKTMRKGVEKLVQLNQETIIISVDEKNLNIFIDDCNYIQELRQVLL
jgi:hypothetical protein